MTQLSLGILGSGFMGQTHAAAASELSGVRIAAVACGSRAGRLAAQYSADYEVSVHSLVSRSDVDAVVVATPHFAHAGDALAAIRAGKPVLIEKPMATTVEDCRVIQAAAQDAGVPVAVGYHQRFRRNVRAARELISASRIGRVRTVQISMPMFWPKTENAFGGDWNWWSDSRSVGHILNSGPHAIDLLRWFLSSDVQELVSYCQPAASSDDIESTTMALLKMECGTIASLYSSNALSYAPFPGEEFRFRIVGSEGLIDLDPYGELRVGSPQGWHMVARQAAIEQGSNAAFDEVRIQAYRDQIRDFALRIGGKESDCGTAEDGLAGVRVCLAMLASSRQRSVIDMTK